MQGGLRGTDHAWRTHTGQLTSAAGAAPLMPLGYETDAKLVRLSFKVRVQAFEPCQAKDRVSGASTLHGPGAEPWRHCMRRASL